MGDLVSFVHDQLSKNTRQAHGVDKKAGMKHSAESWGTGRAVARIPRVSGSGTHRSGQAAFGNMCRKGRMAHPLQTWRRWHRVMGVSQLPLILDDAVGQVAKTRDAIAMLKSLGVWDDVRRVLANRQLRAGKGKLRDRRHKHRRGPLFVVDEGAESLRRALRNIPGVDICNVNRLNIRQLAPGGHLGRFCVWTQSAFAALERIFGNGSAASQVKGGYRLQNDVVSSSDLNGLINSDAIQSVLRETKEQPRRTRGTKANPLRNRSAMEKLNPYSKVLRVRRREAAGFKKKDTAEVRKAKNTRSKASKNALKTLLTGVDSEVDALTDIHKEQIASMNIK